MIKDLMRLDTEPDIFYSQTIGDLNFISSVLEILSEKFLANIQFLDREIEADNILDAEWQFSQLINEISSNACPFSPAAFPETQSWIDKLRNESEKRKKQLEEVSVIVEHSMAEPVVTHAELNGLLGSA
ncbi:MAG: hypothetical protein LBI12_05230 [Treponema sp.]|jgi:primosomal protein N''|nr:hypothetical protein [Treponema sp.]